MISFVDMDASQIKLSGDLEVGQCALLQQYLLDALSQVGPIEVVSLDLSEVTACDLAFVQVIFSLQRELRDLSKQFVIVNTSQTVLDCLKMFGLTLNDLAGV